ncbi:hypothetical protein IWW34DRAFT_826860 [Fusarium oxysporum f. sp. albedinis]|nr:hypothetical protein IWW34DRAFT_826860 [Fusarium oxysporum f. sp. albedinis]
MRFSSFLLAACASSAFGQFHQNFKRFTNTSIPATTTSSSVPSSLDTSATTTGSSAPSTAPVSLGTAQLGAGASYTTALDGSAAVSLFIRNGVATFRLVPFLAAFAGRRVFVIFSIFVRPPRGGRKRQAFEGCSLEVQLDGQRIYNQVMTDTGGSEVGQRSNPVRLNAEGRPDIQYFLTCGSDAVEVVVSHLSVEQAGEDAETTPIAPLPTGTVTPGVTDTNSEGATTNSEGETVIPSNTATLPGTNSEGFTTNSDGETVIPSTTAALPGTNSEGFTTNSEGETVMPPSTNSAGFTTNSNGETIFPTGTATGTQDQSSAPTATSPAGFPDFIDAFTLFGCVGSTDGFPTFELAQSDASMDLDQCSTLCQGRAYFGVYDTQIDGDETARVELDSCDIECPGDDSQFCGGDSRRGRMHRRQAVPSNRLLTVYVAAGAQTDVVTNEVTRTVTDQSTFVTTFATTVAGPVTTATERVVYIFVEADCSDCDGQWVYVPEVCDCQGGFQYVPYFCFAGSCSGKTVYKSQECHDWWNYKNFYIPADCEVCSGGEAIYKPWDNSWGTPENCKTEEIPACKGPKCPLVYPNNNKGQNRGGSSDHGGSSQPGMHHGGSNSGSNGGSSSDDQSKGSNDNSSKGNGPECIGDSCTGPYGGESNSKPNGSHESNGGDSYGEPAPGGEPTGAPMVVSGAGKQVASFFALLAALAPALL